MSETLRDAWAGRSLLVLGAGYVGGAFVREAIARGVRVTALTRNAEKAAELRAAGCARVIETDLATDAWHTVAAGPYEYVLNCVSAGGGAAGYRHSYVDGMRSVSRWLAGRPRGGTIVYTSSTGVYPQGGGACVDEEAPTEGAGENGRLLREAERELACGAGAAGWRWFVLRLAGIYGPGRHGMLDEIRRGGATLRGEPAHRMNLVHRDDVCGAVWACLGAGPEVRDEVFNVSDNAPAPRAEAAEWLARRLDAPCPRFGDEEGGGASAGANPFGRRRAPDRIIVAEKIRRVLGWSPRFPDYRAGYGAILATED